MTLRNEEGQREIQIGGQAVIEGVVMRGPSKWALAVRRPNGEIFVTVDPAKTVAQKHPKWNIFVIRGILALADSLIIGMKSLTMSANIALEEEDGNPQSQEDPGTSAGEGSLSKNSDKPGKGQNEPESALSGWEMVISITLAMVFFVGIFIAAPTVAARFLDPYIHNTVLYNLVEGVIRVTVFIIYLVLVSLMPDIRRVFEYHGAEHKTVNAYESGMSLYPGSVIGFPKEHMRCGTSFLLIVMVLSVVLFSFFGRPALWLRIVERLAIIPLVAGISYEIIKLTARYKGSRLLRIVVVPGIWLQKITTREPDKDQIEVAIRALEAATSD